MPFSQITLSRFQLSRLRRAARHPLALIDEDSPLIRHGLCKHLTRQHCPGGMETPTGYIRATQLGHEFLLYHRRQQLVFWLPVLISSAALLISLTALLAETGLLRLSPSPQGITLTLTFPWPTR